MAFQGYMAYRDFYGCWFVRDQASIHSRYYLPQVDLKAHTTIQSTASRTRLRQTFLNNTASSTPEVQYTFPLYDGVSVVAFKCTIGDKVIYGVVKERNEAQAVYKEAVARGEAAGLLEQMSEASDVFSTKIGNIPQNEKAIVEIEYVGELKHDAQLDGVRFSIPTTIAPRYGTLNPDSSSLVSSPGGKIEIVVDVEADDGAHIEGISSPSHPIAMSLGRTSTQKDTFRSNRASATLTLGTTELGKDFVIVINAQEQGIPKALLEEHPDIPNHRALMVTLVPKFNLPNIHPEVVFVVDRSGSMDGKMHTVVEALKVFLKSLPLSAKFNICSFGSNHKFLFPQSVPYDERSLQHALREVDKFQANYGGTELLEPIKEAVKKRLAGIPLEIMILTDGEIWNQQEAFDFVNGAAMKDVRLFSLGIGTGASTSLVEGLARAGNGFAQFVQDNEKMDKRVVRMLKAALSPHINNYHLQINYGKEESSIDDGFEMIESSDAKRGNIVVPKVENKETNPISLFDADFKESSTNPPAGRYDHLPNIDPPNELQAPHNISGLFPFNRVCAYLLLPDCKHNVKSVLLKGTYSNGPIELEIPIQNVGRGKTIHQLAAKKAMLDTEEGRGWLSTANAADGITLKSKHTADWERIVEREAVRLGVQFQIAGKFCSFVAIEACSGKKDKLVDVSQNPLQKQNLSVDIIADRGMVMSCCVVPESAMSPPPTQKKRGGFFSNKMSSGFSFVSNAASGGLFGSSPSAAKPQAFGAPSGGLFGSSRSVAQPQGLGASSGGALFSLGGSGQAQTKPRARLASKPASPSSTKKLFGAAYPPPPGASSTENMSYTPASSNMDQFKLSSQADCSGGSDLEDEALGPDDEGMQAKSTPSTVEAKVHRIIALQRFDGSWTAVDELFKLVEVWKGDFADASMKYEDETVKTTILAIAWLEKEASKDKEIWEMVVDKAKEWLATTHGVADADEAIRQAIMIFFP